MNKQELDSNYYYAISKYLGREPKNNEVELLNKGQGTNISKWNIKEMKKPIEEELMKYSLAEMKEQKIKFKKIKQCELKYDAKQDKLFIYVDNKMREIAIL